MAGGVLDCCSRRKKNKGPAPLFMRRVILTIVAISLYAVSGSAAVSALQAPPAPGEGREWSSGSSLWMRAGASEDLRPAGRRGTLRALGQEEAIEPVTGYLLRTAYIIPTNRTAQTHAVTSLRNALIQYQDWYREQMERNGFGPKTFGFETEADGITPKVHVVAVRETDEYLRGDLWERTLQAASAAGVPVWTPKQVWWLISEAHLQLTDGTIAGGTFLGASFGSGDDPGVGMIGGDALARFGPWFFTNDASFDEQLIPDIGPYALKQDVSFPWFEGTTFSSISSSVLGGALHEISHGFGQPHDFRNDNNFNGNLMGNGLRGFRGALFPVRYASDYTRLAYGSALALNVSRYFNPRARFTDNTRPSLNVTTAGTTTAENGLLRISFTASDAGGLSAAWLCWEGDRVDEMVLSGTTSAQSFSTAYYETGRANQYTVVAFDAQGNRTDTETSVTPQTGFNCAPQPFVQVSPPTAVVGQDVILMGTQSTDPDGAASGLQVEWDMDGDGNYETAPSNSKMFTTQFLSPGSRLIRARLTDPSGAQTVSAPMSLQIENLTLFIAWTANQVQLSWTGIADGFTLESTSTLNAPNWKRVTQAPVVIGNTSVISIPVAGMDAFFRLTK